MGDMRKMSENARKAQIAIGVRNRANFLEKMAETGNIHEAATHAGVSLSAYHQWRSRFPDFAARVDACKASATVRELHDTTRLGFKGDFAGFAKEFFGHTFAWFHLMAAEAFETAEGGSITLMLWPPEHGKTTVTEDYDNFKLALDPKFRITVASESQSIAAKILGRVKGRMEAGGSARKYVQRFGPFRAPAGRSDVFQPWAETHFNVWRKGNHDERDYNMTALGIKGAVIGTRSDLMQVDDPQSSKSLQVADRGKANTEQLLNVFRGDWLSRPGTKGHTVVNGSRQGEWDFYQALIKTGIVDRILKFPAFDESRTEAYGSPWLWPENYTEREYEVLRRNAGEERWALTYQQEDGATTATTFPKDVVNGCRNAMRSVLHDPPKDSVNCIVGLDPAIGSYNGVVLAAMTYKRLSVMSIRSVPGLTNNDQVLGLIEEYCHQVLATQAQVNHVVIESKAYQKALMDDRQLHSMQGRFGFTVTGHDTGLNKYDENLGIPQMVYSMRRGEIDFPDSDQVSRDEMEGLYEELDKWRPGARGNKLRMDRVMALWFVWMYWRNYRTNLKTIDQATNGFKAQGLPYKPTSYRPSGLAVVGGR